MGSAIKNGDLDLLGGEQDGRVVKNSSLDMGVAANASSTPVNTVPGTLTGSGIQGEPLLADPGTWTGSLHFNFLFQYKKDGVNIGSPTASNLYYPPGGDVGGEITFVPIATNDTDTVSGTASNGITVTTALTVAIDAIDDVDVDGVIPLSAVVSGGYGSLTYAWALTAGTGTISNSSSLTDAVLTVTHETSYTVRLIVTDDNGDIQDTEDFTYSTPILTATPTAFGAWDLTAEVAGDEESYTYLWEVIAGDGSIVVDTPYEKDTSVTTTVEDDYTLRLTITNDSGSKQTNVSFTYAALGVVVTAIPDDDADGVITLAATVTGGFGTRSYLWELIDGTGVIDSDTSLSTTLTVTDADSYQVKLTVTDNTGSVDDTEDFDFTPYVPSILTPLNRTGVGADILYGSQHAAGPAWQCFDSSSSSTWFTTDDLASGNMWVGFDFGTPTSVSKIRFIGRGGHWDPTSVWKVQVYDDVSDWNTIHTCAPVNVDIQVDENFDPFVGTKFRLKAVVAGTTAELGQIEFWG